jgi:pyruvate dehydrogenase (quinone)
VLTHSSGSPSSTTNAASIAPFRIAEPGQLTPTLTDALHAPGPVLIDVLTNPEEIALPPKTTAADAWGFATAKSRKPLVSPGDID